MPDDILAAQQLTALEALNTLGKPPDQETVSDLLTALQHFSDARGYDFTDLLATAQAKTSHPPFRPRRLPGRRPDPAPALVQRIRHHRPPDQR